MVRGFLKVNEELDTKLPERQTKASAGYDFYVIEDVEIPAYGTVMLPTNVKAYMQEDEVLMLYARSSLAIKRGLILQNTTGIIDSDFFPHEIKVALRNTTDKPVKLLKNERCAQGIFLKYLVSDNGNLDNTRDGGIGSTKK
jgi:dUTP pyrophosphatase